MDRVKKTAVDSEDHGAVRSARGESLKVSCNVTLIDDNLYPLSCATLILQLIASQYKGPYINFGPCQVSSLPRRSGCRPV